MIWPSVGFLEIRSHVKKSFFEKKKFFCEKEVYLINDLDQDCSTKKCNTNYECSTYFGNIFSVGDVYDQDPIYKWWLNLRSNFDFGPIANKRC